MPSNLLPQSAQVPFGYAMLQGDRVPVMITPEWFRFLAVDLFKRAGTFEAMTNTELEALIGGGNGGALTTYQHVVDDSPAFVQSPHVTSVEHPHARLESLEAEVTKLTSLVEGLLQGVQI